MVMMDNNGGVQVEGSCGQMLRAVTGVVTHRVRLNCIRELIQDVSFLSGFVL